MSIHYTMLKRGCMAELNHKFLVRKDLGILKMAVFFKWDACPECGADLTRFLAREKTGEFVFDSNDNGETFVCPRCGVGAIPAGFLAATPGVL